MAYDIFEPKFDKRTFRSSSREAMQATYDRLMSSRVYRLEQLSQLVEQDGIDLDYSETSLQQLCDWFYEFAKQEPSIGDGPLSPNLESICLDIGLYLGDMLIRISDRIKWVFWDRNPKDGGFQQPVITGFNVENKDYYVCLINLIRSYAFRLVGNGPLGNGGKEEDMFIALFKSCKTKL
jgi:hypothetical protein